MNKDDLTASEKATDCVEEFSGKEQK
jgi:hypothetical protein